MFEYDYYFMANFKSGYETKQNKNEVRTDR